MAEHVWEQKHVLEYRLQLIEEEKAAATVEKYLRDIRAFGNYLAEQGQYAFGKEAVLRYKESIAGTHKAASVNSMLVALNRFFAFLGWNECRVRLMKVQRGIFRDQEREMSREEYRRLCAAAKNRKNQRLYLLLQCICSTGIRVSEHPFLTAEAVKAGHAAVSCKGRTRTVFLPERLKKELAAYCRTRGIVSGPVFITRTGKPLDRRCIWGEMKALCQQAGVPPRKVFPHNLRHLFAVTYYRLEKDIVRLADLLGHASIDTTRIYTSTTWQEHTHTLSRLHLVI